MRLHPFGEHAGVIRRVGGLEENKNGSEEWVRVIRRVGGLEETRRMHRRSEQVIRRVGGLEGGGTHTAGSL